VTSADGIRMVQVLALALASAACASAQASPQGLGTRAGVPARTAAVAPRAPAQPSSAWDEQRQPAPKLGLAVGPACQQNADCAKYVSECTDQPICDGLVCVPMASLGTSCSVVAEPGGPGICRQRVCEPAAARPEVCGETLLNGMLRLWERVYIFGKYCVLPQCLEEQRQVFERLELSLGESFVGCLAAPYTSLVTPIDWSPTAPYASPFPAPPGSAILAPTQAQPRGAP
jgi:hypothetical protein